MGQDTDANLGMTTDSNGYLRFRDSVKLAEEFPVDVLLMAAMMADEGVAADRLRKVYPYKYEEIVERTLRSPDGRIPADDKESQPQDNWLG